MKSHVILAISLVVLPHSLYSADYDVIRVFDNEFYSIANPITVDVTGIRAIFASFHSVSDKTDTQISSSLPNAQVISYNILETAALENPSIKSRLQQMKYKEKTQCHFCYTKGCIVNK